MIIDRNNYEEYFLRFADNELSEQEKFALETFVKLYPDLEEELAIIKLSIVKPDNDVRLLDKSFLFKQEDKFISPDNYQQVFILYYDDELTAAERKETETFALENPALKNEFELFKKIKLEPAKRVTFPNKRLLYKKDDDGKVLPIWWKALAAAIIAGLGIWIGVDYLLPHKNNLPATANNTPKKIRSISTDTSSLAHIEKDKLESTQTKNISSKNLIVKTVTPKNNISKLPIKKSDVLTNSLVIKKQKQSNNLPDNNVANATIEKENSNIVAKEEHTKNDISLIKKDMSADNSGGKISTQNDVAINSKVVTPDALNTSYVFEETESSGNYAFYNMSQERFSKTKLGGLLHKVKRVIERKLFNSLKDNQETARN
jgi:hypothetical protein